MRGRAAHLRLLIARWLVAPVVVLAAAGLLAQRAAVPAITSQLVDVVQLLDDLRALSADDMEGRAVGTAGGEKARAFLVRRFKESGIVPFGQSYAQTFALTGMRKGAGANIVG